jgi:hypothetical protein
VGPPSVIIPTPCSDLLEGMIWVVEQRLIEQFVTHPPVKTLDERILGWLPGAV